MNKAEKVLRDIEKKAKPFSFSRILLHLRRKLVSILISFRQSFYSNLEIRKFCLAETPAKKNGGKHLKKRKDLRNLDIKK